MKKLWLVFILTFLFIVFSACSVKKEEFDSVSAPTATPGTQATVKEASDYSIVINNNALALKDWFDDAQLEAILGKPENAETSILKDADTFNGSHFKKIKYQGLYMELFSPKDNGKTFWVSNLEITTDKYKTGKGISKGYTVQQIKEVYPSLEMVKDGRTDPQNCSYEIRDEQEYNYIQFDVTGGKVNVIKIFHLLP